MLKKRVIAAVAAALMAGGASAVEVSRDGVGDFLIAPAYFIGGGMSSTLKVINTSPTLSTVAKVVFRDPVSSAEILDFLVYLSPNDVWTGTVKCLAADANGNCNKSEVRSADDSQEQLNSDAWASPAANAVIESSSSDGRVALPNQGYVDIEMGPTFLLAPNQSAQKKSGVSKDAVRAAYNQRISDANLFVASSETPNILTGSVTAHTNTALGSAEIPLLALANYDTQYLPQVGVASGLDTATQRTPVADVEEAIWKNNIVVPYNVDTGSVSLATFTFPTKLTYNGRTDGQYGFSSTVCYVADVFDTTEQTIVGGRTNVSPMPSNPPACVNEFDFKLFGGTGLKTGTFVDGWARIKFNNAVPAQAQSRNVVDSTNVGRSGVPVIATYMTRNEVNKSFTWTYAASAR